MPSNVYTPYDTGMAELPSTSLPGEIEPIPMRYGGDPITDTEALGVARRLARQHKAAGRKLTSLDLPDELPPLDAPAVQSAHRIPPRLLLRVRAKAEMEGRTVTSVILEALEGYAASPPGARVRYIAPRLREIAEYVEPAEGPKVTPGPLPTFRPGRSIEERIAALEAELTARGETSTSD